MVIARIRPLCISNRLLAPPQMLLLLLKEPILLPWLPLLLPCILLPGLSVLCQGLTLALFSTVPISFGWLAEAKATEATHRLATGPLTKLRRLKRHGDPTRTKIDQTWSGPKVYSVATRSSHKLSPFRRQLSTIMLHLSSGLECIQLVRTFTRWNVNGILQHYGGLGALTYEELGHSHLALAHTQVVR